MSDALNGRAEILETINRVAADVLGSSALELSEETTARDVSGWDSLSHVQIVVGVENAFGVRFNSTEIAQLENTGSLVDLVQKHFQANGGRA
jgi:acyl carrier protein